MPVYHLAQFPVPPACAPLPPHSKHQLALPTWILGYLSAQLLSLPIRNGD